MSFLGYVQEDASRHVIKIVRPSCTIVTKEGKDEHEKPIIYFRPPFCPALRYACIIPYPMIGNVPPLSVRSLCHD